MSIHDIMKQYISLAMLVDLWPWTLTWQTEAFQFCVHSDVELIQTVDWQPAWNPPSTLQKWSQIGSHRCSGVATTQWVVKIYNNSRMIVPVGTIFYIMYFWHSLTMVACSRTEMPSSCTAIHTSSGLVDPLICSAIVKREARGSQCSPQSNYLHFKPQLCPSPGQEVIINQNLWLHILVDREMTWKEFS